LDDFDLIVEFGFVVLEPLHFSNHVCVHFFVNFESTLELDSLLNRVDDLQKAFAIFCGKKVIVFT
jgi:hypothetical protein